MGDLPPESDRLTRIEAVVERLEIVVGKLADKDGRPNWNMLGVFTTVTIALVGALLLGPIANNEKELDNLGAELHASIQREIDRNNRLEREMGAVLKVDELFQLGKLKLD